MKLFFTKLLIFLIPILIVVYPLDYIISYNLSQSNKYPGEFEVWNDIYNSNANCDMAIYGSSRAWVQIDPKILSDSLGLEVYNFGIDGHNFWLQHLRHLELLKYNKKPKTIIFIVDIYTLEKRRDLYESAQFLPYMLWNKTIQDYTVSYVGYDYLDYYIPLVRYAGQRNSLKAAINNASICKIYDKFRFRGFKSMDRKWNNDLENAMLNEKTYISQIDNKSITLFEKFIKNCIHNRIQLIIIYPPEQIDGQKFVSNREEVIDSFNNLTCKYSLKFIDYSKDNLCFDKKYFYNATHLNKLGSEIFSRNLASRLKADGITE